MAIEKGRGQINKQENLSSEYRKYVYCKTLRYTTLNCLTLCVLVAGGGERVRGRRKMTELRF